MDKYMNPLSCEILPTLLDVVLAEHAWAEVSVEFSVRNHQPFLYIVCKAESVVRIGVAANCFCCVFYVLSGHT